MSTKLLGIVSIVSVAAVLTSAPVLADTEPARASAPTDVAGLVSPQVILKTQRPPKYPPAARAARYSGSVLLETTVMRDGSVGEVKVLECTRPKVGFEEAATDAVKKWRFQPGQLNDKPVEVTLKFRLNFDPAGVSLGSERNPAASFQDPADSGALESSSSPSSSQAMTDRGSTGGP